MLDNIVKEDVRNIISNTNFNKLRKYKKILITGSSGLIGSYLLHTFNSLDKEKFKFRIYYQYFSNIPNYLKYLSNEKVFFPLKLDLTDFSQIGKLDKFDLIIHGAGYAQPSLFMKNSTKTYSLNTISIFYLINKLKKNGTFLFMSSSDVYRGNKRKLFREKDKGEEMFNNPRYAYIEGKKQGEEILKFFGNQSFDIKIVRISSAYGPCTKINDNRVINSFIKKSIKNNIIEMLDPGNSIQTFCYISDLIEMILNVLLNGKDKIYNITGPKTFTIRKVAETISKLEKVDLKVPKISSSIKGSPAKVKLSTLKYNKEFKKKSYISLNEGLERTIKWQKINLFGLKS
tara:strand:+ start:15533 stop:16564 length:1032 start_codon:yes stop_codon:yes gene_type:complete